MPWPIGSPSRGSPPSRSEFSNVSEDRPASRQGCCRRPRSVDRSQLSTAVERDLDAALAGLGGSPRRGRTSPAAHATGVPGVLGRGYWVMRTALGATVCGRRPRPADYVRDGGCGGAAPRRHRRERSRRPRADGASEGGATGVRMLTSWPGGVRVGDLVVAPHLPNHGRLSVFEVEDSYRWDLVPPRRFGERSVTCCPSPHRPRTSTAMVPTCPTGFGLSCVCRLASSTSLDTAVMWND